MGQTIGQRGLILGFWNSHVSLGNILGGVVAGIFVDYAWGWSFFVPGAIVALSGILSYFFLVPFPEDLGFPPTDTPPKDDDHDDESSNEEEQNQNRQPDDIEPSAVAVVPQTNSRENVRPITFFGALIVPGVIEYSLCLFFLKATAYIFLFWLPKYLKDSNSFDATLAADISAIFDVGGILGGIFAGFITDRYSCSATVCVCMIIPGMPLVIMLLILGFLIVGPYCLITTAVSADLGTHESLHGNARALATVVSIIDGTGSLGAAVGPCLVGLLIDHGWVYVFLMLIIFLGVATLCLMSRSIKELHPLCGRSSRHYTLLA
ncbi:unnamed protein product [Rodentolepis nana]|uniref:MFS domain-containing protein n=1 Tax=Rodentolepis nana TaxID=102285 RepID=A0A0R3TW29_RODNA|nr:unnamed protein product [Rodentolepis nana]